MGPYPVASLCKDQHNPFQFGWGWSTPGRECVLRDSTLVMQVRFKDNVTLLHLFVIHTYTDHKCLFMLPATLSK